MVCKQPAVVMDMGSTKTRVGFAGEEAPRVISSTVVGEPRQPGLVGSLLRHHSNDYAGDAARAQEGRLNLRHVMHNRRITSFQDVEHFMQDVYYSQIPLVPNSATLLWVEPVCTLREDREHLCEMVFESLDIPSLGIVSASAATVYSTGRTSGIVLDSGEDVTTCNAVWEGYNLQYANHTTNVAGRVLTDRLMSYLRSKGYALSTLNDRRLVEDIKHKLCYVAMDVKDEVKKLHNKLQLEYYGLPDDQRVYLHESQFMVPELLFNPRQKGTCLLDADHNEEGSCVPAGGWADIVSKVVQTSPHFTQRLLYKNIILGGGNTMLPGTEDRLQQDVTTLLTGTEFEASCVAFQDRDLAAWIGGSVVASMPTFPKMCLSRKDYLEKGAAIIHQRI